MKRRLLSAFLVILMLLTMIPASTIEVFAAGLANVKSETEEEVVGELPTEDETEEASEEITTETEDETEEESVEENTEEDSSVSEETTEVLPEEGEDSGEEEDTQEVPSEEESETIGDGELAETYGDFTYSVLENEVCITGYSGTEAVLKIPAEINGYKVTSIGDDAFNANEIITQVMMPDSIISIGKHAFYMCSSLETVQLPRFLQVLGADAFYKCISLDNVAIPKTLHTSHFPFRECSKLENVSFEEGISNIPSDLFYECTGLTNITLPEGIVEIGSGAFARCSNLEKVVSPDSVRKIEYFAFTKCKKLKSINLSLNLETIRFQAFAECESLESIHIPKSLKEIDDGGDHIFKDCTSLKKATFEEGTEVIIERLFECCESLSIVEIPDSVRRIEDGAFLGCYSLVSIQLPENLTYLGDGAFSSCTSLAQIELPSSLKYINDDTFHCCFSLKEITIPAGITGIGNSAFEYCQNLETVHFEEECVVSSFGPSVFANCSDLEKFTIPDTVKTIGRRAFSECESLKEINFGNGIEVIPESIFWESKALEEVVFPCQVKTIDYSVFAYDIHLKKVTIPASVTCINGDIFQQSQYATIYGVEGSYAHTYAIENGIPFVSKNVNATDIKIRSEEMSVTIGETKPIVYHVEPLDVTSEMIWSSSDSQIVTVENGTITGVKAGTATITVEDKENPAVKATCKIKVVQPVKKIEFSTSSTTINAGESIDLEPNVLPADANNKELYFYSEDESIATVSQDGIVLARSEGKTQIYALAMDGSGVKKYCSVKVLGNAHWIGKPEGLQSYHPYDNDGNDILIYNNPNAEKLSLTFSKDTFVEDGKDTISIFAGSNKEIGTYTGNELAGKVVEVPGGEVRIQMITDSENVYYGFKVDKVEVIEKTIPLQGISLSDSILSLKKGTQSKLEVIYEPRNTNIDKTVTWSSDNEEVATVKEDGTVVGVSSGIATITAKVKEKKATCKVYVWEGATGVTLTANKSTLYVGEQGTITYAVSPLQARINDVTVSSSNKEVASVNLLAALNKVEIIPLKEGKTTITVIIDGVKATYNITVSNQLSLDYQDGTGKVEKVSVSYNKPLSVLEEKVPERDGYYFVGWYTGKNGTGEAVTAETVLLSQRILYAHWQKISNEFHVMPIGDQIYNGKAHKPAIRVYDGEVLLEEKVDYTISYKNNIKANDASNPKTAPSVIVKGINNYKGSVTVTFKILPQNISGTDFEADNITVAYKAKKIQKSVPVLMWNGKKLKAKTDFTVTYPDTQDGAYSKPGVYNVIIKGAGNFTGERKITLTITQATLMSKVKVSKIANQEYQNGAQITPELVVKYGKETLVQGLHYEVSYENNCAIGTATAIIVGKEGYSGIKRVNFNIVGASIAKAKVEGIAAKTYDGTAKTLDLTVSLNSKTLVKGTDYEVSYQKNVNAGTAEVSIKGINAYSGTLKKKFKILSCDIAAAKDSFQYRVNGKVYTAAAFENLNLSVAYEKGGSKPVIEVYSVKTAKWLTEGKDYTLSYTSNNAITTETTKKQPVVSVSGKGNYKGKLSKNFVITAADIVFVSSFAADKSASAKAGAYLSKPVFTDENGKALKEGSDYTIAGYTAFYPDKTSEELNAKSAVSKVGTKIVVLVNGKGTYCGEKKVTYLITEKAFKGAKVAKISKDYTGKEVVLTADDFKNADGSSKVTIKDGKTKKELTYGKDFVIVEGTYKNNVKKGTATVTIKGCGEYGGTMQVKFTISQKVFFLP